VCILLRYAALLSHAELFDAVTNLDPEFAPAYAMAAQDARSAQRLLLARFPIRRSDGIVRHRSSNRPIPSAGRDLLDDPKAKMTGSKLVGPSSVRCSFNFQVGSFDTSQLAIPRLACRALGCDEDNRPVQGCANGRRVLLLSPKDRSRRQLRQRSESPRPASNPHVSRFVYGRR
jgi:hypothetical protein